MRMRNGRSRAGKEEGGSGVKDALQTAVFKIYDNPSLSQRTFAC